MFENQGTTILKKIKTLLKFYATYALLGWMRKINSLSNTLKSIRQLYPHKLTGHRCSWGWRSGSLCGPMRRSTSWCCWMVLGRQSLCPHREKLCCHSKTNPCCPPTRLSTSHYYICASGHVAHSIPRNVYLPYSRYNDLNRIASTMSCALLALTSVCVMRTPL